MNLCDDIAEILDLFYEHGASEPDWAAIGTRIHFLSEPKCAVLEILKAFHAIYEGEDIAAAKTELFASLTA